MRVYPARSAGRVWPRPSPSLITTQDIDLSTLPAEDYAAGGDGAYILGGLGINVLNAANASILGLDGATGLRMQASSGAWGAAPWTAPLVHLPITTLAPDYTFGDLLRIWLHMEWSADTTINGQGAGFGVQFDNTFTGARNGCVVRHIHNTLQSKIQIQRPPNGTTVSTTVNMREVYMFEFSGLTGRFGHSASYSSDFPLVSALSTLFDEFSADTVLPAVANGFSSSDDFVFWKEEGGAGADIIGTLARLKVEHQQRG